ncbi:hypothetical protein BH10ACT1_BH10ACT1_28880 [soil metagenome]
MDPAPVADRPHLVPTDEPTVDPSLAAAVAADRAAIAALASLAARGAPAPSVSVTETPAVVHEDVVAPDAARCPIPGVSSLAPSCPVRPGSRPAPAHRSKADLFVRRLLRIKERPPGVTAASAYATFQRSMLISATRCTLTYVVFPFILPGIGFLKGVGPVVGVVIGSLALVCDTFTIRRFFSIDHKYRWYFGGIAFGIMCLLSVLLVQDVSHLVTHGLS